MALNEILDILMFASLCGLLLLGFPVAFTLGGVALAFAVIGTATGVFDAAFLNALPLRIFNVTQNETLIAVPLFVFMGVMLERSRVAEELLEAMGRVFGQLRGGLGISVFLVGALLAASTGIVGATVVTMGLISLPTMLRHGYDRRLAAGTIAASGTLGQIIPPSIALVLLGDTIGAAYQLAQREQGIFSPETMTVGDLFAGALLPGLALVSAYILYQVVIAVLAPARAPALDMGDQRVAVLATLMSAMRALVAPLLLIVAVLGSILTGVATPTEAAAVGAAGATLLAGYRLGGQNRSAGTLLILASGAATVVLVVLVQNLDLRLGRDTVSQAEHWAIIAAGFSCALLAAGLALSLWRVWGQGVLSDVVDQTTRITTMVFTILIGAALFAIVFRGLGGDDTIHAALSALPGGEIGAVVTVMAVMFILGFFLDFIEIVFVVVPIVAPVLLMMDVDPVWLGVMMAMNLQTSFLTPPFGFALFYLRGVAPPQITTLDIYRGVMPFVMIQLAMLVVLAIFPGLATWLPQQMFG